MKNKFNPWPIGIVLVFVLFIGGMATAVVIACTHRDNLVDENYYESELKFQSQIDAAARAQREGASITQPDNGNILVRLPAAQLAQTISGVIELYRPSAPELDHVLALQPDARGVQTVSASKLNSGSWVMRVKWTASGENYFLEQKIKI
jgi:hypothetical protein